ncbi:MAG: LysM peptidoglycan-binding domain-containing protein [Clostridia bacterium]|nr:LysM peptidoglycan-binding domain-containing protein [Clostridia bacterium]
MLIHKVEKGESLYSISEKYGLSPRQISEINNLTYTDRLSVGRELLILIPTRTHTSRRGEKIEDICRRFCVSRREILKNNPALATMANPHPEQTLSLRYPERSHGLIFTTGYLYGGFDKDRLSAIERYLSEVILCSAVYDGERVKKAFNDKELSDSILKSKKGLALRIYPKGPYREGYFKDGTVKEFIDAARRVGAGGIVLPIPATASEKVWLPFIKALTEAGEKEGLYLTLEVGSDTPLSVIGSSERKIFSFDPVQKRLQGAKEYEFKFYNEIYPKIKPERAMLDLSPFAYRNGEPITVEKALSVCDKGEREIIYSDDGMSAYFYDRSDRYDLPTLEYIKAKLDLIGELGFMGVCIDICRCPISHIMLISSLFHIC